MRITTIAPVLLLLSGPILADDTSSDAWISTENAIETAMKFAQCAGLNEALSITAKQLGRPAAAENLHNQHNGARVVSAWFLATEHNERTGAEKSIGDFTTHIDGVVETRAVHILSLIEQNDWKAIEPYMAECIALDDLQAEVVKYLRATSIMNEE